MIPALIMALIALLIGGDSPYLVPNMDKYVKKCVVEKEEKKQMLLLLKDAQKLHKSYLKSQKKEFKHLNEMLSSKDYSLAEYTVVLHEMDALRKTMQENKRKLLLASKNHINEKEWKKIQEGVNKDIGKLSKKLNKNKTKLEKQFTKVQSKISKTIDDDEQRKIAIHGYEKFKADFFLFYTSISGTITDKGSVLFNYNVSESQVKGSQEKVNTELDKMIKSFVTLHFVMIEATTDKEWEKIKKKVNSPF